MSVLMFLGGALGVLSIIAGAVLLAVAVVIVVRPRWYVKRWGQPIDGRLASYNSGALPLSMLQKRPGLYTLLGADVPFDDQVADPALGEEAAEDWLARQERLRNGDHA